LPEGRVRPEQQTLMFRISKYSSRAVLVLGVACLGAPPESCAAAPIKLSGAIGGLVTNAAGDAQMGASVVLYDRLERVFGRVYTDERGEFRFPALFPEIYSVRVTLASFVPALKRDILVQPGMRAMLNVNLTTLFSSIQIAYPPVDKGTIMTDDWKWMLRTAASTRPVLRFVPDPIAKSPAKVAHGPVFSDTRGLLELSAGDGPQVTGIGNQADMGTAFALATSVYGNHQLELSGNLGYGTQTGVPAAAFRTAYAVSGGPEISVTMRQLFLPGHGGIAAGADPALPALRSVSASVDERTQLTDEAALQYGFTMDSVSFGDRVSYFSPYARLVYSLGDIGDVALAYSSGNARPDLASRAGEGSDLQRDLSSVGMFPRISVRNGRFQVQRGNEFELSFSRKFGSRRVDVSAYRETVNNAALSLASRFGSYPAGSDLLPDLFTGNAIFNAGNYTSTGYTAALTQSVGQNLKATIMWGTTPGLSAGHEELVSSSPDELRSMIRASRRQAVTAEVAGTAPWTGTHLIAGYQWLGDAGWVTLGNLYSMQSLRPLAGLNLYIRQPLPGLSMLPWRIEATADLRNLLAEGYLPVNAPSGPQAVLVENPRSFRGGLSFIF
jgi:Carboxypeptidase regulatory-like domain/TonB dependent receptor